jgi:aspartyl-tRNA(Asn)/glutamyl-tRNA(Gln) amidotransferase subunit B
VEVVRSALGELPAALRSRIESEYSTSAYDADVIVSGGRAVADYYLAVAAGAGDGKLAANWVTQTIFSTLKDRNESIEAFPIRPARLIELLQSTKAGDLDHNRAREVFDRMLATGETAPASIAALGIKKIDDSELEALCRELLAANPNILADLKAGKAKAAGALVGQAKKRNPNADPNRVREICLKLAEEMEP